MYKILVIEDELEINKITCSFLEKEGYHVKSCLKAEHALKELDQHTFDLILLDIMLPEMSGEDFLVELRKKSETPVIIISALNDELLQQRTFMMNIDDYIVKPVSMKILMYKISAVLRRIYKKETEEIIWNNIKLVVNNYEVYLDDTLVNLTAKEFDILQILMLNIGRVYTRDQLLDLVWGYDYFGDNRNVDVHIKNIRKKLDSNVITTVSGIGYRVDKQ